MSLPTANAVDQEISDNNRKLSINTTIDALKNNVETMDGGAWPNSHISDNQQHPITLYPLENTRSNPLPLTTTLLKHRPSSSLSDDNSYPQQQQSDSLRRTTTPDLGHLDSEEQAALEADITARRAARRISRRQMSYSEEEEEEEEDNKRVVLGTPVAEGHRNYQLM